MSRWNRRRAKENRARRRPAAENRRGLVLLLSHHRPDEYDRCFRIGGRHVCRRCAVLYPIAFAVAIASLAGVHWPAAWDKSLLFFLPLPVTLEFVIERFGGLRYHAGRQMLLTLVAAPALGRGFARYLVNPGDRLFWMMVLLFGGSCLFALLASRNMKSPS
jgi:hypothetical protein